MTMTTWRPNRT